jgi:hypothetical protein
MGFGAFVENPWPGKEGLVPDRRAGRLPPSERRGSRRRPADEVIGRRVLARSTGASRVGSNLIAQGRDWRATWPRIPVARATDPQRKPTSRGRTGGSFDSPVYMGERFPGRKGFFQCEIQASPGSRSRSATGQFPGSFAENNTTWGICDLARGTRRGRRPPRLASQTCASTDEGYLLNSSASGRIPRGNVRRCGPSTDRNDVPRSRSHARRLRDPISRRRGHPRRADEGAARFRSTR